MLSWVCAYEAEVSVYHHLRGQLYSLSPTEAIIEAGGLGYRILISLNTYRNLKEKIGQDVFLFLYHWIREDGERLFGFSSEKERDFFSLVVSLRGFGPGHALALLSGLSLEELLRAIREGNSAALCKVRGIGRKSAERLIFELRDRLPALSVSPPENAPREEALETARLALQGLGFSRAEATFAVEKAREALPEGTVSDWIRYALRES